MAARTFAILVLAGLSTTLVAGCMSDSLYSMELGGSMFQDESGTFSAGDSVRLSVAAGGTGTAKVTLKDGAGDQVFQHVFGGSTTSGGSASNSGGCATASGGSPGSGGTSFSCTIDGEPGTWHIDVDFTNYAGGFTLSVNRA